MEFDVFLSHNSNDKPAVRELARCLRERGICVWLDEDQLIPGRNWQPLLEEGIERSATGAVLVGKDGLGPWEDEEMQALLDQAVHSGTAVIPVLLPGASLKPRLPIFLRNRTWVDLRPSITDQVLDRLIWGITGEKPRSLRVRDEPTQQAATAAAGLWPEDTRAAGSGQATNCYARLHSICARGEVPATEECRSLWQTVKKDRLSSFLAWQLATVARWGRPEYLDVDEHFTPLQIQVRVREGDEGPSERQQLPFDTLAEAMSAVFEEQLVPASVIFAPPGGGKSTLLRHYQLQQARRLGAGGRLVLYVQLRDYRPEKLVQQERDPALPALAWLESEWRRESGRAPPLAAFLRQGSLTLLLDGLNEIPRDSDDAYRARVGEWRDLLEAVDRQYPGVHLLFACRPLDYSQRLDAGRHTRLPEIEVQAMEPERIKTFIDKRFERRIAGQVWVQLQTTTIQTTATTSWVFVCVARPTFQPDC